MAGDHLSAGDLVGGQDEQGAQQLGGPGGVEAELGEDAPALHVGEAVLDGGTFHADQLIDLLLRAGEGLVRAAFLPVITAGCSRSSSRPAKPRSAIAARPASRILAGRSLWRAVVISLERPGRAAEIHSRFPEVSVSARNSRPWHLCFPELSQDRDNSGYPDVGVMPMS